MPSQAAHDSLIVSQSFMRGASFDLDLPAVMVNCATRRLEGIFPADDAALVESWIDGEGQDASPTVRAAALLLLERLEGLCAA